jgi:hypothetical protein
MVQGRFSYWVLSCHASLAVLSSKVRQALDLMAVTLLKVDEESAFVPFHSPPMLGGTVRIPAVLGILE